MAWPRCLRAATRRGASCRCRRRISWKRKCCEPLGGCPDDAESALAGCLQCRVKIDGKPRFEHRRIERRLVAGKGEIGLADPLERRDGVGAPVIPGLRQRRLELFETA